MIIGGMEGNPMYVPVPTICKRDGGRFGRARAAGLPHCACLALGGLNVSQRWRCEVSCRFHMAQRPAASIFAWAWYSDMCKRRRGRACWVLGHSALPQRCPSVANGFQPKRRARTGERAACKGANSKSGLAGQKREEAPAADRLREPEPVHDEVGLTSQQRGQRSVAGI
jgi:hypothetical protein